MEGSYPITSATLEHIDVLHSGTFGIWLHSNLVGSVHFSFVIISIPGESGLQDYSPKAKFEVRKGNGNSGW